MVKTNIKKTTPTMETAPPRQKHHTFCHITALLLLLAVIIERSHAFSSAREQRGAEASKIIILLSSSSSSPKTNRDVPTITPIYQTIQRRKFFSNVVVSTSTIGLSQSFIAQQAQAYTPDPDPLRESLYLMSRVQEATVQQERFVNRATSQDALKSKMKLTLRLVEKNYRLLDQITFASEFVSPADKVVDATTAGYEAADALQNAIDYVKDDLKSGPFEKGQKEYLAENLSICRERLFDFLEFMPKDKLEAARKRVEEGMCRIVICVKQSLVCIFGYLCYHLTCCRISS